MVKLKLQRVGRRNQPYFRIIAIDSRKTPRAEALEILGSFDPTVEPAKIEVKEEAVKEWLKKGAQTTETVQLLLERAGVLPKIKREPRNTPSKASKKAEGEEKGDAGAEAKQPEKAETTDKGKEKTEETRPEKAADKTEKKVEDEEKKVGEEEKKEETTEAEESTEEKPADDKTKEEGKEEPKPEKETKPSDTKKETPKSEEK